LAFFLAAATVWLQSRGWRSFGFFFAALTGGLRRYASSISSAEGDECAAGPAASLGVAIVGGGK
jgi:hypothetical protein